MKTRNVICVLAASSVLMVAAPLTGQVRADSTQKQKNDWRNLAIGAGVIAAHGAIRGNGLETVIGAAGAAYAGKHYEDQRKHQSQMNSNQQRYYRSGSYPVDTYTEGNRKYYWYNGQQYVLDTATGDREAVTTPPSDFQSTRSFHRAMPARRYYSFNGHRYYMDNSTGERVMVY